MHYSHFRHRWVPEIKHYCPKTPFILVGAKVDLREDQTIRNKLGMYVVFLKLILIEKIIFSAQQGQKPITPPEGNEMAKTLKAFKYLECSAKTREGISTLLDETVRVALAPPARPKRQWKCKVL